MLPRKIESSAQLLPLRSEKVRADGGILDPEFSGRLMSFYPVTGAQCGEGCLIHAGTDEMYSLAGSPEARVKGKGASRKGKRTLSASEPFPTQVHTQGEHTCPWPLAQTLVHLGGTSWRFGNGAGKEKGQTKWQLSFSQVTNIKPKVQGSHWETVISPNTFLKFLLSVLSSLRIIGCSSQTVCLYCRERGNNHNRLEGKGYRKAESSASSHPPCSEREVFLWLNHLPSAKWVSGIPSEWLCEQRLCNEKQQGCLPGTVSRSL